MRQDKFSKQNLILYSFGVIPVIWLGLLIAPAMSDGLKSLIANFGTIMANPFHIELCEGSLKTVLVLLFCYLMGIGIWISCSRNYRKREEHGSATWGSSRQLAWKYGKKHSNDNKILTRNVSIGLDGRKHMRNLNVLVVGGSGSGKTRFYAKPNIMQANTSFMVLDPNGYNLGG